MSDRKERIRAYKETPRPMGVFLVRNLSSGRTLVGSSVDLPAMLNRTRFQLELGAHPNRELQRDWEELGGQAFEVAILDTLEPREEPGHDPAEDLSALEALWTERLSAECELYDRRGRR